MLLSLTLLYFYYKTRLYKIGHFTIHNSVSIDECRLTAIKEHFCRDRALQNELQLVGPQYGASFDNSGRDRRIKLAVDVFQREDFSGSRKNRVIQRRIASFVIEEVNAKFFVRMKHDFVSMCIMSVNCKISIHSEWAHSW